MDPKKPLKKRKVLTVEEREAQRQFDITGHRTWEVGTGGSDAREGLWRRCQTVRKGKIQTVEVGFAPGFLPMLKQREGEITLVPKTGNDIYPITDFDIERLTVREEDMIRLREARAGVKSKFEKGNAVEKELRRMFKISVEPTCKYAPFDLAYLSRVGEPGVRKYVSRKDRTQAEWDMIEPVVAVEVKAMETGYFHWGEQQRAHAENRQIAGLLYWPVHGLFMCHDMAKYMPNRSPEMMGELFPREVAAVPEPVLTMGGGGPRTPEGTRYVDAVVPVIPRKMNRCRDCGMLLERVRNLPCEAGGDHGV